jgi:alkyldihydroxyacetonephosphate synthase
MPRERVSRCVSFRSMSEALAACRSVAQSELHPTLVRLYDEEDAAIFLRHFDDPPRGPLLLLAFDGPHAAARATTAVEVGGGGAEDERFVAHWWAHRNDAVHEYRRLMAGDGVLGPHAMVDTMEVAATWTLLPRLYEAMKTSLAQEADVVGCHLSHVYPDGGCLYFTMGSACSSADDARAKLERWWTVGMEACLGAGGTISHHHGIGRVKAPWLKDELGGLWEVLAAVKRAVDPHGIMNPGALGL